MNVGDLVRAPLEVLEPGASCLNAALVMRERHVGSIVIVEHGRPIGIVTDHDLVTRVMAPGYSPERIAVHQVMTAFPMYLSTSDSAADAVRTMRELAVRHIPVVDEVGTLAGMVALDDLALQLGRELHVLGLAVLGRQLHALGLALDDHHRVSNRERID